MNLTAFLANKCLEYFLQEDSKASGLLKEAPITSPTPPWAAGPETFGILCTGCGECAAACTEQLIFLQENGLPAIDFSRGPCSFCGDCARSCPAGALRFIPENPPWELCASAGEACLARNRVLCRTCAEQCDQKAVVFPKAVHEEQIPEFIPELCTGCGACYDPCPVGAVFFIDRKNNRQEKS